MIFYYDYSSHDLENLHALIEHLVKFVWCEAEGDFSYEKLHSTLKEIVVKSDKNTNNGKSKLGKSIELIYNIFLTITQTDRDKIYNAFDINNMIERLCTDKDYGPPMKFSDLTTISNDLSIEIKDFFTYLWEGGIKLKAIEEKFGNLNDHYLNWFEQNDEGICPFCGIYPLEKCQIEDYDHYLPKGVYPFISVNFSNLAPICQRCNSRYKHSKIPIETSGNTRRLAFYPYANFHPGLTIIVTLQNRDLYCLTADEIDLNIECENHNEQVETWMAVFKIEKRYKEKCLSRNCGRAWYSAIIDEHENVEHILNRQTSKIDLLRMKIREAKQKPNSELNFLKKPFLEACEQNGMFEEHF